MNHTVFLGLGGNIGPTATILRAAIESIRLLPEVYDLAVSKFYKTTPVADTPQPDYINAVCRLETSLSPHHLFEMLQQIAAAQGQGNREKNAARVIDIDMLHYGTLILSDSLLQLPHPRWSQRLFVLRPLLDVASFLDVPNEAGEIITLDVESMVRNFQNRNSEVVVPLDSTSDTLGGLCIKSH